MSKMKNIIIYMLSVLLAFVSGLLFAKVGITKAVDDMKPKTRYYGYRDYYNRKEEF